MFLRKVWVPEASSWRQLSFMSLYSAFSKNQFYFPVSPLPSWRILAAHCLSCSNRQAEASASCWPGLVPLSIKLKHKPPLPRQCFLITRNGCCRGDWRAFPKRRTFRGWRELRQIELALHGLDTKLPRRQPGDHFHVVVGTSLTLARNQYPFVHEGTKTEDLPEPTETLARDPTLRYLKLDTTRGYLENGKLSHECILPEEILPI